MAGDLSVSAVVLRRIAVHCPQSSGSQELTGHVPPAMMRSKDRASGMPWLMQELLEVIDSLIDFRFSSPFIESRNDETRDGRR